MTSGDTTTRGAAVARHTRLWPGPDQLALRAVVAVGTLTALWAAVTAGSRPPAWLLAGLIALGVLFACYPDTGSGVGVLAGTTYTWALAPDPTTPLLLLAAGGMVATHGAALVAAQGPAGMRVDGAQVRLWLARGVLAWSAAAATWGLSHVLRDVPGGRLTQALGLLVLVALAAGAALRLRTASGPE